MLNGEHQGNGDIQGTEGKSRCTQCLETDGHWHLTGYVPRQLQDVVTTSPPAAKQ